VTAMTTVVAYLAILAMVLHSRWTIHQQDKQLRQALRQFDDLHDIMLAEPELHAREMQARGPR
jgi:hypothetical protein